MAITIYKNINDVTKVYKIKYDNTPMYNILLEYYDNMTVNNFIVETLFPLMNNKNILKIKNKKSYKNKCL